ncbi:hypothetical protein KSS87_005549, partial [Heliosperma pusillum]
YFTAFGTSGTSFVRLVHLALVLCVWYIYHYFSASGTSGTSFVRPVHLTQLWCIWYICLIVETC